MEQVKRDSTTGQIITTGQQYRTHYRGTAHECYSLVTPSSEAITQDYLRRHPEEAKNVPPVEVMS